MKDDQSLSHRKWGCKYHVVFIPKYRRKRTFGTLRTRGRLCRRPGYPRFHALPAPDEALSTYQRRAESRAFGFRFIRLPWTHPKSRKNVPAASGSEPLSVCAFPIGKGSERHREPKRRVELVVET